MSETTTTTTGSRRKQQKPARLGDKMSGENTDKNSPNSASVIVKTSDLKINENDEIYLKTGTILGPFRACPTADSDDEKCLTEGKDITGRLKLCSLDDNKVQLFEVIRIAKSTRTSNCDLFESEGSLYIRVTRPVDKISDLRANFRSPSSRDTDSRGHVTPDSSPCSSIPNSIHDGAIPSTSNDIPFYGSVSPHAIYLPVAFHDNSSHHIQVIGYPQIVIPVAISRTNAALYRPSIFIDETLSRGLNISKTINIGETSCNLNLSRITPLTEYTPECSTAKKRKYSVSPRTVCKKQSPSSVNDNCPLDLSLHQNDKSNSVNSENGSPNKEKLSSEIEKRYRCDCGVSFNSESTLTGHKKYYCKNVFTHCDIFREPQKKTPNRCQQCEFQPVSASQLAQHIRTNHSTVQAYLCQICGYKGYSQRGIKSHLRSHKECSNCQDDQLMTTYVFLITADTKLIQCPNCRKNFSSKNHLKQHICDINNDNNCDSA